MRFVIALFALITFPALDLRGEETADRLEKQLLIKFESLLGNLLRDESSGCVDCHSSQSMSSLILSGQSLEDFRRLLDGGYLRAIGPDTLLGRITSQNPDRRMPKESEPWSEQQVADLQQLVEFLESQQAELGIATDEQFPRSLLSEYHSDSAASEPTRLISYRQLRAKVLAIFDDDWIRGDRDLFSENVAAFGGADFKTRFNESSQATATFLSALEMMSRDVASRAYRIRFGPFAKWEEPELTDAALRDSDLSLSKSVSEAVAKLFQSILFRSPTDSEQEAARGLLRDVCEMQELVSQRDSKLVFEVLVTDPKTALTGRQTISIPVRGERLGVRQTIVDQRASSPDEVQLIYRLFRPLVDQLANEIFATGTSRLLAHQEIGRVHLGPENSARLVIHNQGTHRNVSFAGVELLSDEGVLVRAYGVDSPGTEIEGAWDRESSGNVTTLEDKGRHKGLSTISVPLRADIPAGYSVRLLWRSDATNADNVLVELYGQVDDDHLAAFEHRSQPQLDAIEVEPAARNSAEFFFDCSDDSRPYLELPATFQFNAESAIQVSNKHTFQRVTAGAVELINANEPENNFLIDSQFAEGSDDWQQFDEGQFKAYNVRGKKLHDDNANKGKLSLRYRLEDRVDDGWRPAEYYRVRIYYPGKRDQDPLVPVTVYAERCSPIVRVSHPLVARGDTLVRLDASSSLTIQGGDLEFQWKQLSGPPVSIDNPRSPVLEFRAPRQSVQELAWVSLCSALIRHPDFLFTRAPSIERTSGLERQRLRLSKLALDLVGRPPTEEEFEQLAQGKGLEYFVDQYLDSQDFRDFYFHRVRLYLESQGTDVQDEPARLWCYVAFNDRPFQEILTADYSVNGQFERTDRPAHHGRTGVLSMKGFIQGKPGLPHYNYAAQVSMLFLGYIYEVPPEIVEQREGVTALGTTDPNSNCYSCHKMLTPLAFQRLNWTDDGDFRLLDDEGLEIDASDRGAVEEYPFKGAGLEAFAIQAARKERFIRTIIDTHVNFYFGRPMRYIEDERRLYKRLWDSVHRDHFQLRGLIRAIVTSPEYLGTEDSDVLAQWFDPTSAPEQTVLAKETR